MPILVGLACVALVVLRAGLPGDGMVLGGGDATPEALWNLWYVAEPFWKEGLRTSLLGYPSGERVWPAAPVGSLLATPLVRAAGVVAAWNVLTLLRVFLGGVGGALLMRRLGLHPAWGALVAVDAATLQGVSHGWLQAGRDPNYTPLLDMDRADDAETPLWGFVSRDGRSWRPMQGPIAHSVTSLGFALTPDGEGMVVSGMIQLPMSEGPPIVPLHPSLVVALTTSYLWNWGRAPTGWPMTSCSCSPSCAGRPTSRG